MKNKILLLLIFLTSSNLSAQVFFTESFEANNTYTGGAGGDCGCILATADATDGQNDYFRRCVDADISANTGNDYTGEVDLSGTPGEGSANYWAGEDIDDNNVQGSGNPEGCVTMTVSITGRTNLQFLALLAAHDANSFQYQADNHMQIDYNIDGAGFVELLDFRLDAAGFISLDTDGNDVGDGLTLGQTFQEVTALIPGSGNSMQVRICMNSNTSSEEFAVDYVRIAETTPADPQIYSGTTDACVNGEAITSTGSGVWQDIMIGGQIIASFNDNGENMGAMTSQVFVNSGAVRTDGNGVEYLDRSIYITPTTQPTNPVSVRYYLLASELADLIAADASTSSVGDLNVTKSPTTCSGTFAGPGSLIVPSVRASYENGFYLQISISSFSGFFANSGLIALPVELMDFDAKRKGTTVELDWHTASEIDNDYFAIERSINGTQFETISRVAGKGTVSQVQDYAYVDYTLPKVNTLYYRLAQVDFNGTVTYSEIKVIELDQTPNEIRIYPNPMKAEATLTLGTALDEEVQVTIYSTSGQLMKQFIIPAASQNFQLNTSDLPQGSYLLKAQSNTWNQTQRFLKMD